MPIVINDCKYCSEVPTLNTWTFDRVYGIQRSVIYCTCEAEGRARSEQRNMVSMEDFETAVRAWNEANSEQPTYTLNPCGKCNANPTEYKVWDSDYYYIKYVVKCETSGCFTRADASTKSSVVTEWNEMNKEETNAA